MVNRYDLPSEQPVRSQYIPLPLEELNRASEKKQFKADQNLAKIEGAESLLEKIPVISEHQGSKNKFITGFRNETQGLLNENLDPSSTEFRKRSSQLINKYVSDPQLNTWQRGVENKKKYIENVEKLKQEGKYGEYNDPHSRLYQVYNQGQNPWEDENGKALEYNYSPVYGAEDHAKPVHDLFGKVKPSGSEREAFNLDKDGNIISVKQGWEGIGRDFLRNIVYNPKTGTENISTFLNSKEGKDFTRQFAHNNPNANRNDLVKGARQFMNNIAEAYVHGTSTEGSDFAYAPKHISDALKEEQAGLNAPTTFNEATDNPFKGQKIITDSNGNIGDANNYYYQGEPISESEYNSLVRRTDKGGILPEDLKIERKTPEQVANQNRTIDDLQANYREIYGKEKGYKDLTRKEIVDLYNEAVKNSGKFIPRDINFGTKKSDLVTPQVLGGKNTIANLSNVPIQVIGDKGGKQISYPDLVEELGLNEKNPITSAKVMGRFANHPSIPGAYKVVVSTKNGTTKTLAVGADEQTESFFKPFDKVFQSNLSGKDTQYKVGDVVYKTINVPKLDGKGFNTRVQIISPNGTDNMSLREFEDTLNKEYDVRFKNLYPAGYNTTTEEKQLATEE